MIKPSCISICLNAQRSQSSYIIISEFGHAYTHHGIISCPWIHILCHCTRQRSNQRKNDAGKEQVKAGVTVVKDAKEQARQLREQVKSGQLTKEQAKAQMQQMRNQVRTAKDQIKAGKETIRDGRRQLRELKRAGKP